MANSTKYPATVKAHLESAFPSGPPHTLNVTTDDWVATITKECPPPKSVKDPGPLIIDAVDDWLVSNGHTAVGVMWVHEEKREAARQAEEQAQAEKAAQETAPLRALIREEMAQVLIQAGIAKPAGIQPSNVIQHPTAHSRKKGPGRGH